MHIKRLEIQGFKTFADRTELELTAGITSVVGPNGSGKSNVADAVSWVLGEQNVRNLRGTRAHDVIFAGSERRKSLGFAEVSLTIDNSCGSLPIDFGEVTVTRRVFRSGEGEYLINKTPCRLKDIFELFLDTGMGREAYSMVSQGEIDAVLSAKSEDRRSLIEEAAGIKKYRVRRKEAAKKLETTETNLRRVNDIVSELSSQVEPLAEQAEEARRFNELDSRLREIETGLLVNDLRRWTEEMDRTRRSKQEGSALLTEEDKRISDLEWEKEKLGDQLTDLDRQVGEARAKHEETNAAAQRVKTRLALIEERRRSADGTRNRLQTEIEQLDRRVEDSRARLERLVAEEAGAAERETKLAEDVSARSKSLEEITAELESASRMVEDRKSAYIELAKDQAAKRTELESLRMRLAELEVAVAKYAGELEFLEENRRENERKRAEFEATVRALQASEKSREEELPPLKSEQGEVRNRISSLNEQLVEINRATVGKASRLSTLQEMAEAHEGFFEGVRSVMAARKAGKLRGDYAVVADVITVPKGYETAIDVALGSAVQDIITDTIDDAKDAIRFLKENRAGRATFLPLNGVRPSVSGNSPDLKKPGVRGNASELIGYDKKYSPAINVLLGRVIVVDNIDNAVKLSRDSSGWGRIVTLDGEVIVPTGAMTGGLKHGKGPNLLGRKQETDDLKKELASLDAARERSENEVAAANVRLTKLSGTIQELEKAEAADKIALVEAERQLEFLAQERKRIEGQIEVVTIEKDEVETALADDSAALALLETHVTAAGRENVDLDELVAGAEKRLDELGAKRAALSEEYMELSVTLASVRERRTAAQQSIKQTESGLGDTQSEIESRRREIERQEVEAAVNAREREALTTDGAVGDETLGAAQKELDELLAGHAEIAQKATVADVELRKMHHARTETGELVRDCDVREARLEVQIAQTAERLLDEYDISTEEALAYSEPMEVERGTATEVARLRREIKAMGPVNTGAVQEYDRVSERWEFLVTQKTDLEEARKKLLDAIHEIDESTKDLFMSAFNAVGERFEQMFQRLFGGGRTELILTDPHNLLDTGVEVVVQTPGKKLQNLQLLSGGERALTASALLFALLLVKPSPFVLFDEVDAALDDANVERFAEVLKDFSRDSQFIVITHNRATMEAADTLYGVTMQEPGVSKLISVRLADEVERKKTGTEVVAAL